MKRVGVHDIARLAKVSIGTVDRALHGREGINKETRKRVLQIARRLSYTPNPAARMLAVGHAPLQIGVCIPREIRYFFDEIRDGIQAEAHRFESLGVTVNYDPYPRSGIGAIERVRHQLASDIRALIVMPDDPMSMASLIDAAEKRNIRVVCICSDAPKSRRSTVVCVEPELNGRCAAELMAKFLPKGSCVAVVTGMLQAEDHRGKTEGFLDAFPQFCTGGKVCEVIEDHEDERESFQKCLTLLQSTKDLDGLYVSTANCLPVCAAIEAAGLAGQVRLITTDLFPQMVPYIKNGTITASIHQCPFIQGRTAVRLVVDHIIRNKPFPPFSYLSPGIVLQSNLALFRELRPVKAQEEPVSYGRKLAETVQSVRGG